MAELLPCPFCSGAADLKWATNGKPWAWIECTECGAKGPAEYAPHGGDAAGAWNKRSAESQKRLDGSISKTVEVSDADWMNEDPGICAHCGKPWELVRPGKSQPTCEC